MLIPALVATPQITGLLLNNSLANYINRCWKRKSKFSPANSPDLVLHKRIMCMAITRAFEIFKRLQRAGNFAIISVLCNLRDRLFSNVILQLYAENVNNVLQVWIIYEFLYNDSSSVREWKRPQGLTTKKKNVFFAVTFSNQKIRIISAILNYKCVDEALRNQRLS